MYNGPGRNDILARSSAKIVRQGRSLDKGDSCFELTNFGGLSGREKHCLAILVRQNLDNLPNLIFETNLKDTIGLVND